MASGQTIGTAYIQIMPSTENLHKTIKSQMTGESGDVGAQAGNSLASKLKGAIAAAGIGVALQKTLSSALSEGGALQQSLGGVETLFKNASDTVVANAERAFQTTGMSANAYMENVTSFSASLISSLGGDTAKAAKVADSAMIAMSDNANKMGKFLFVA